MGLDRIKCPAGQQGAAIWIPVDRTMPQTLTSPGLAAPLHWASGPIKGLVLNAEPGGLGTHHPSYPGWGALNCFPTLLSWLWFPSEEDQGSLVESNLFQGCQNGGGVLGWGAGADSASCHTQNWLWGIWLDRKGLFSLYPGGEPCYSQV